MFCLMKNTFQIKFHPLFYASFFLCFLTGYLKYFLLLFGFLVIHELGHITGGIFFHWKIEKVLFLPFGGMTIFHEKLNRPIQEEAIIVLLGPLYRIFFYFLLSTLFSPSLTVTKIHYFLLFFNLLPIYPLDGFKMFFLFDNFFFSYWKSHYIAIFSSYFWLLIFFLFTYRNGVCFLLSCLFFQKTMTYQRFIPLVFEIFLWERYQQFFPFSKQILISKIKSMKRDYIHRFKEGDKTISEREKLRKMFDLHRNL